MQKVSEKKDHRPCSMFYNRKKENSKTLTYQPITTVTHHPRFPYSGPLLFSPKAGYMQHIKMPNGREPALEAIVDLKDES